MKQPLLLVSLILLFALPGIVSGTSPVRPLPQPIVYTGLEEVPANIPVVLPPYPLVDLDGLDIIGDTLTVGTTWYEYQHNALIGRQICLDDQGYIHLTFTKGEDPASSSRHVYYNYISPTGSQGWTGLGTPVESAQRGGFTSLAVGWDGLAFPAFHQITGGISQLGHSAVAVDFFPHTGAFLTYELPWYNGQDLEYIWPRICMKLDGQMLVTSVGNSPASGQTWSMGTYDPGLFNITYTPQILTPTFAQISNEVGASRVSNRVGGAYCSGREGDNSGWDIHAMIDDNGVDLNFDNYWNVTNFIYPDLTWLPDTLLANGDTLRAYADVSLFFDLEDYAHMAFTTCRWFQLEGGLVYWNASIIWHWSERDPNNYQVVAYAFDPSNYIDCGGWNFRAQRPSLGQDPETGYLYCMYQEFDVDSSALSQGGWPSGEIKISVSTDNGATWSVGTNVTNTVTPSGAVPGQCQSEAYPSMAEVVDGYCHILYIYDVDAGANLQGEGTITLNRVVYHKVPVDQIPTTPVNPPVAFHVSHTPPPQNTNPNTGTLPDQFALYQNTPNPFNPTTQITFSLDEVAQVKLTVYNLRGELIATLTNGVFSVGSHNMTFDGTSLASGVYIYRLEAGMRTLERKMLLLK